LILTCVSAGAAGNFLASINQLSANAFKSVIDIDVLGSYNTLKATLPYLVESAKKHRIDPNTRTSPTPSQYASVLTKQQSNLLPPAQAAESSSSARRSTTEQCPSRRTSPSPKQALMLCRTALLLSLVHWVLLRISLLRDLLRRLRAWIVSFPQTPSKRTSSPSHWAGSAPLGILQMQRSISSRILEAMLVDRY